MAERVRRADQDLEPSGRLASGVSWQGVRTTALDQVEQFCRRSGMDPAQFMSSMGWIRSGQWQGSMDWRNLANSEFDRFIRQNLRMGGVGLNLYMFNRRLEGSTVPRPAAQAERQETAPPERQAAAPARTETFVYHLEMGVLDRPQRTYVITSPTPIENESALIQALARPGNGIRVEELVIANGRETRVPVADTVAFGREVNERTSDPIGTWDYRRVEVPPRRRESSG